MIISCIKGVGIMEKELRRNQILGMIHDNGAVETYKLCQLFNVSDMTIRRDLDYLMQHKGITRTHGGAMSGRKQISVDSAVENQDFMRAAKEKIALKGLELLGNKKAVFIDSGTTTCCIAENIAEDSGHKIVTNNLKIVAEVSKRPNISVEIIGGSMRASTMSCYGSITEDQIKRYKVDVAFLGAKAIAEDGYIYDGYAPEVGVKKRILQSALETYVLVDSSKFNTYSLMQYSHVLDVTGVITDSQVDKNILNKLLEMGANIIVVD